MPQTNDGKSYQDERIQQDALIDQYKKNIDMVSYLTGQGFRYDRKKSTRRWAMMVDDASGRKLLLGVNAKSGDNYFYNPEDSRDKGTIIHLMAEFGKLDLSTKDGWEDLHRRASELIGNVYFSNHDHIRSMPKLEPGPTNREGAVAEYYKLKPLTDTTYLTQERLIAPEILLDPEFVGKILNRNFTAVHPDSNETIRGVNTVFPLENELGMQGIIARQTAWNHTYGDKSSSMWVSNILPNTPVKEIVITENPINALSYHKLHPPQTAGTRVYIATAGQPAHHQYTSIQQLINTLKPEKLTLGFDNDLAGIRYNINAISRFHLPNQPLTPISVEISNNRYTNTLYIELQNADTTGAGNLFANQKAQHLRKRVEEILNRNIPVEGPRATIELITTRPELLQIRATFPNQRPLLIRAENIAKEFKQTGNHLVIHRSIENDFNDDLKVKRQKEGISPALALPILADLQRAYHRKKEQTIPPMPPIPLLSVSAKAASETEQKRPATIHNPKPATPLTRTL